MINIATETEQQEIISITDNLTAHPDEPQSIPPEVEERNSNNNAAANTTTTATTQPPPPPPAAAPSLPPVSQESVNNILAMGFSDRGQIEDALRRSRGNVEGAIELLLGE